MQQVLFGAERDTIGFYIDGGDVNGMAEGDADAFAFADGEVLVAWVCAEDFAGRVDELAGGCVLGEEMGVVVVGNKTNVLRVGFIEDREAEFFGDLADALFFH